MREHALRNITRDARIIEHVENSLRMIGNVVKYFGKWCSHGISLSTVLAFSQVLPKRVKRQTATGGVYKRRCTRIVATRLANLVGADTEK